MKRSRQKTGRLPTVAGWSIGCAIVMLLMLQLTGCGGSDIESKQKSYQADWKRIMTAFDARVTEDDKKASELVEMNDISGLIKLINERIVNVNEVIAEILGLHPPDDLQDLHSTTLYYLTSLRDQLEAQNDLNEAVLSGKPTQDLKTISDNAAARTQVLAGELGVEIQKAGIGLDEEEDGEKKDEEKKDETSIEGEPSRESTL